MEKILLWFLVFGIVLAGASALPIKIIKTDINPDIAISGSTVRLTAYLDTLDEKAVITAQITMPDGESVIFDMKRDITKDVVSAITQKAYYLEFYKTIDAGIYIVMFKAVSEKDIATATSSFEIIKQEIEISKVKEVERLTKQPRLQIFGTEYDVGDRTGRIFIQLVAGDNETINNGLCKLTAYYPNNSVFIDNQYMNWLDNGRNEGLYYYDFAIPNITGVYMISAVCYTPADEFADDFIDYSNLEAYNNITIASSKVKLATNTGVNETTITWNNQVCGATFNNTVACNLTALNTSTQAGTGWQCFDVTNAVKKEFQETDATVSFALKTPEGNGLNADYFYAKETMTAWQRPYLNITYTANSTNYTEQLQDQNTENMGDVYLWQSSPNSNYGTVSVFGVRDHSTQAIRTYLMFNISFLYPNTTDTSRAELCLYRYSDGSTNSTSVYHILDNSWGGNSPINGYIQSEPINLTTESWLNYSADYDLKEGNINFSVLDGNNNTICSGLGDISSCANNISPIKLRAELTRTNQSNITPEIERWEVSWMTIISIEEIRGGGELHISSGVTEALNLLDWIKDYLLNTIFPHQQEMKQEISNIENMTYEIRNITNETLIKINWLLGYYNITTSDLNMFVIAPSKCLAGTNWLCRAQVRDRYGNVLSPLDDVYCNVTTDLWGESEMTYAYAEEKWKYIHQCNPAYTTFNWTVECDRLP